MIYIILLVLLLVVLVIRQAYDLLKRFTHVWLNDKNEYTPSKLSNMLFKAYDDLDGKINDLSTKEILDIIYKYGI